MFSQPTKRTIINIIVIISLFFIPVIGLLVMWLLANWSKKSKVIITISIIVLSLLISFITWNYLIPSRTESAKEEARVTIIASEIKNAEILLDMYYEENNEYPANLEALKLWAESKKEELGLSSPYPLRKAPGSQGPDVQYIYERSTLHRYRLVGKLNGELIEEASKIQETDKEDSGRVVNWKEELGFEVVYPENTITLSRKEDGITLRHSVPFEHPDPCDFKGGAPTLGELTDFDVSIKVVNQDLKGTVTANETDYVTSNFLVNNKLKITPGFIDETSINSLKGYRITSGAEGCGQYTYYFPLDSFHTFVVIRSFITELQPIIGDYEEYLNLPGVIKPDEEERLFNQILSTFRFLK